MPVVMYNQRFSALISLTLISALGVNCNSGTLFVRVDVADVDVMRTYVKNSTWTSMKPRASVVVQPSPDDVDVKKVFRCLKQCGGSTDCTTVSILLEHGETRCLFDKVN